MAEILAQPEAKGVYLKREHSLSKPYHGKIKEKSIFLLISCEVHHKSSVILERNI